MNALLTALRALIYGGGFVLLWWWVAVNVQKCDTRIAVEIPPLMVTPGLVLMGAGGALAFWCIVVFVMQGKGTPAPFDAPREFVAVGPYRYVRNPMYIGGWLMLVGIGLYERSVSMFIFSLVWLLIAHLFVVVYEEPHLERRFGQPYLDYKKSMRRWIPNII